MEQARFIFNRAEQASKYCESYYDLLIKYEPKILNISKKIFKTYNNYSDQDSRFLIDCALGSLPVNYDFAKTLQVGDVLDDSVLSGHFPAFQPTTDLEASFIEFLSYTSYVAVVSERRFGIYSSLSNKPDTFGLMIFLTITHEDDYLQVRSDLLKGVFRIDLGYM